MLIDTVFHIARREEWGAAERAGVYRRSTRGLSFEEQGYIHLSFARDRRFHADGVAPSAVRFRDGIEHVLRYGRRHRTP